MFFWPPCTWCPMVYELLLHVLLVTRYMVPNGLGVVACSFGHHVKFEHKTGLAPDRCGLSCKGKQYFVVPEN